jgi:hypothetical protein
MDGKIEQRACIKFCVKLSKSATETLEMLREAFGEHALSRTAVFEWHPRFKSGRGSVEDGKRSGQRSTSKTTENVEEIRDSSRRPSPNNLSGRRHVGISYGVCQDILTENLNMRRTAPLS